MSESFNYAIDVLYPILWQTLKDAYRAWEGNQIDPPKITSEWPDGRKYCINFFGKHFYCITWKSLDGQQFSLQGSTRTFDANNLAERILQKEGLIPDHRPTNGRIATVTPLFAGRS